MPWKRARSWPQESAQDYLKRYPRITSHIICESLGYATPSLAARVLKDAKEGRQNYCEWIACCYSGDPRLALRNAIRHRQSHKGFMADYRQARAQVEQSIKTGEEPLFGTWF